METTAQNTEITMDKVGLKYDLEEGYSVELPEGKYLVVCAGVEYGSTASKFEHENILQVRKSVHNFRAYWPSGYKRWRSKPGIDFFFAIPKERITVIPEKGYSYVPIEIGGERFNLNVSGGGNGVLWTDYVSQGSSIGIFTSKKKLKVVADNAIIPTDYSVGSVKVMDEHEQEHYNRLCAYYDTKNKLQVGDKIVMLAGYTFRGSKGPFPITHRPKRKQRFICYHNEYSSVRIKYSEVDWLETARVNGIETGAF